jgi:hypothetical protein
MAGLLSVLRPESRRWHWCRLHATLIHDVRRRPALQLCLTTSPYVYVDPNEYASLGGSRGERWP